MRKIVFPAAGMGTRFLPATKATPKEMLTVVDKPMIQYGVEEALAAGLNDIIMITGRGKHAIEDHFDISAELEAKTYVRRVDCSVDVVGGELHVIIYHPNQSADRRHIGKGACKHLRRI